MTASLTFVSGHLVAAPINLCAAGREANVVQPALEVAVRLGCDSDRHGDDGNSVDASMLEPQALDRLADPVTCEVSRSGVGPRQRDDELLAALAEHPVTVAATARQHLRNRLEDPVTRQVTVSVVVGTEASQVDEQHRDGLSADMEAMYSSSAPVRHSGQGVGAGLGGQPVALRP